MNNNIEYLIWQPCFKIKVNILFFIFDMTHFQSHKSHADYGQFKYIVEYRTWNFSLPNKENCFSIRLLIALVNLCPPICILTSLTTINFKLIYTLAYFIYQYRYIFSLVLFLLSALCTYIRYISFGMHTILSSWSQEYFLIQYISVSYLSHAVSIFTPSNHWPCYLHR